MFDSFLTKIFGSRNDRLIRQYRKRCAQINKLEPEIQALTDEQLRGKTAEFRERLDKGETLDALLPEAFAVVREASRRVLGMRHFDVQLIGGLLNLMPSLVISVYGRHDFQAANSLVSPIASLLQKAAFALMAVLLTISNGDYTLPYAVFIGVDVLGLILLLCVTNQCKGRQD